MGSDVDKTNIPHDVLRFLVDNAKFWNYEMLDDETIVIKAPDRTLFNSTYWDAGCADSKWGLTYLPLLVLASIDGINRNHMYISIESFTNFAVLYSHAHEVIQIDEDSSFLDMDEVRFGIMHLLFKALKKRETCLGTKEVFIPVSQVAMSRDAGMQPCTLCK